MATRGQMIRDAENHNRSRFVDFPRRAYDSSVFCNNTVGGFSVIGESVHKNNIVMDYVAARRSAGIRPIVILSNSEELENKLIQYIRSTGGNLAVVSPAYKSYSIFSSMKEADIVQCIFEAARTVNADTDDLVQYVCSVLTVMRACSIPVSLYSMIKLLNSANGRIVDIAKAKGVYEDVIASLQLHVTKHTVLRYLLSFIADSAESFADTSADSGRSLISLINDRENPRDIIFIRPETKRPELINYILASELQSVAGTNAFFIFDNINSCNCEQMQKVIDALRCRNTSIVGECIANPAAAADAENRIIKANSFVLFPGGISQSALQSLIPSFGKFVEHNVQTTYRREAFHIFGDKSNTTNRVERDRLLLSDLNGMVAIFGGDKGVTLTVANAVTGIFEGGNDNGSLRRI